MKNVVVLGGGGFIGGHLSKRLKDNGFEGNFLDYKEKSLYDEGTLILKIGWNV